MENKAKKNISNSIVLIGPCGVGKSLIANSLSNKANKPLIDIDDLIHFTEDYILRIPTDEQSVNSKLF